MSYPLPVPLLSSQHQPDRFYFKIYSLQLCSSGAKLTHLFPIFYTHTPEKTTIDSTQVIKIRVTSFTH